MNSAKSVVLKMAGVLPLLSALYSPPAAAVCDSCVTAAVGLASTAITSAVTSVQSAVTSFQTTFEQNVDRLIEVIGNESAAITSQVARTGEMTVQGNQRTESVMEQNRQDDRYQVSDSCAVLASTRGSSEAGRSTVGLGGGSGRGGGRGSVSNVSSDMAKAMNISSGSEAAPSPEAQAAYAASGACSSFVSGAANKVRATACKDAGFTASASNGFPDADIRAETLFDGPQVGSKAEEFRRRLTIDSEGAEASAVNAYLRNLNTPIDLRQLKKGELQTDMGRQYIAYRDAYEARMSLAEKPARVMAGNRFANKTLVPVIEQLLASDVTGPFVESYLSKNFPKWKSKGISLDELTNLELERRYMNRNWHIAMAAQPPEVHVKEQTAMLAFQGVLLGRILNRLDEQAVLAGQTTATQVRQEMMPQLMQMHAMASK